MRLCEYVWEDDPVALAQRGEVDVFVELIGGADGPAKAATEAAIASGKDVVTANKAMLAHHGQALATAAEAQGRVIRFEAAVAGGIPVVKALCEGLAEGRGSKALLEVMERESPTIESDVPLEAVLEKLQLARGLPVFVVDDSGLLGLVTASRIGELAELESRSGR